MSWTLPGGGLLVEFISERGLWCAFNFIYLSSLCGRIMFTDIGMAN